MLNFQEDLITNLKFYRKEKGISQERLAEMCDCATSTIGCIECGRQTPSFELLVKIADALRINPADLFLRNASTTITNTKKLLKTELIPQIEDFVEKRL
ncbi:MAG: helix-turn-helix transcriptional regulator [Spirochaetaceae bacterium]|nr:helix-turn-helix transcriptional regulator [Spirochaetaceae bacterium]